MENIRASGPGERVRESLPAGGPFPLLKPGQYQKLPNGHWRGCTPNGEHCNLQAHRVTEHEDGTITVNPSILISITYPDDGVDRGRPPGRYELWHGWLEHGYWRSC